MLETSRPASRSAEITKAPLARSRTNLPSRPAGQAGKTRMTSSYVCMGGGLSGAGELLAAPLREELAELCLFPVRVETSDLGGESVALGAVRLALDHVEHALFGVVT